GRVAAADDQTAPQSDESTQLRRNIYPMRMASFRFRRDLDRFHNSIRRFPRMNRMHDRIFHMRHDLDRFDRYVQLGYPRSELYPMYNSLAYNYGLLADEYNGYGYGTYPTVDPYWNACEYSWNGLSQAFYNYE